MIKHMVFDIGNVLMHWQPQRFFHDLRHHEKLCSLLFRSAEWQEYDRGACTLDDLRQAYVQAYPQH
ncbi:MAG: HAD family phosphatase, partial [Merdibacter sp.]|nr:HAD family phosphatase [Merdibacter sp.]